MCEIIENLALNRAKEEIEETRIKGIVDSVNSLMKTMKLTISQAFDALQVSESDQRIVIKRI